MYINRDHAKKLRAFRNHRKRARRALIEFDFTFEEWCAWWEKHLGSDWMRKRGHYGDEYVMARYFDDGPYAAHNVKCITASANCSEVRSNMKKRYSPLREFRMKHGVEVR